MSKSTSMCGPGALACIFMAAIISIGFATTRKKPSTEKTASLPAAQQLRLEEKIEFATPAPAVVNPAIKCDAAGDFFVSYSESLAPAQSLYADDIMQLPVFKLSTEAKTRMAFPLPTISDYPFVMRSDFQVDPRGVLWALVTALNKGFPRSARKDPKYFLVRYNDDGTVDSQIQLIKSQGGALYPERFAVFSDGSFFVTGTIPDPNGVAPFAAVYDRYGRYVKDVEVPEFEKPSKVSAQPAKSSSDSDKPSASASPPQSNPAQGQPPPTDRMIGLPDGNVYLLRSGSGVCLYAVSPSGDVIRSFALPTPPSGLRPVQVGPAGISSLFVEFVHFAGSPEPAGNDAPLFEVVNLENGEVTFIYRMDPAEPRFVSAGCAASPYDFLFLGGSDNGKLEIRRYTAP